MKKVLLTGGMGFLGINLTNYLLEKEYYVTCVDYGDLFSRKKYINTDYINNVTFINVNLIDEHALEYIPSGYDYVIHLAALPHVDFSNFYPSVVLNNNLISLMRILDYVVNNETELIFTSSVEVYGGESWKKYCETDIPTPVSIYGYSKQACEELVKYYINKYQIKSTIVRLTNLFGPLQLPDRVIPRNICRLLDKYSIDLTQNFYRDFLYVEDACRMIECLMVKEKNGEIFNLSTGKVHSMQEVINSIVKNLHTEDIVENDEAFLQQTRGRYLSIDNVKIKNICSCTCNFEQSIVNTVKWYKDNYSWGRQFEKYYSKPRIDQTFIIDNDNLGYKMQKMFDKLTLIKD